ncbi:MAG: serine/threonine-protein kinase [Pirellulaceae bacterium]
MPPSDEPPQRKRNPIESIASELVDSLRVGKTKPLEPALQSNPQHEDELRNLMPVIERLERARKSQSQQPGGLASLGADRPERLGDFDLVRQIGRGGMGVVFEAIQRSLGRRVAVKVLPKSLLMDQSQLTRFEREARTAAALHHTNIVPVFGVGEDQGFHYFVMQCIDGRGLDRVISEGGDRELDPLQVARLGRQAASALDYAHVQKVLHRDIKPANLIVNKDGDLWVTDFGVAKAIESEAVTRTGDVVGTLRYMAPEQILGVNDFRSDIYSLGVTLYELLAGRPAMDDASIRSAIVSRRPITSPPPIRQLNPAVPRDLETILHTAMAIDPSDRYQSAGAMAEDLERFTQGETISVRPLSFVESSLRWAKRNPALAAFSSLSILLLLGVAATSLTGYLHAQDLLHREQLARNDAEQTAEMAAGALDQLFQRFADATGGERHSSSPFSTAPALSNETAQLLEDLVHYFDAFASRTQANPKLRQSAIDARSSIGDIHLQLGQYEQAIASFQMTLDNLSEPSSERTLSSARLHNRIGYAHKMLGDSAKAEQEYQAANDLLKGAFEPTASNIHQAQWQFELARSHFLLGMRVEPGMRPTSMPPPMALRSEINERGPRDRLGPQNGMGPPHGPPPSRPGSESNPRDLHRRQVRPDQTQGKHLYASLVILRRLVAQSPQNVGYNVSLAACLRQLAGDSFNQRNAQETDYETEAIDILRKLHQKHPNNATVMLELAAVLSSFTVYEPMDHDDHLVAVDRIREAVQYCDLLATSHPNIPQYNNALVHSHFRLGVLLERMNQHGPPGRIPPEGQRDWEKEASDAFQQAAMRHAVLLRQHPDEVGYRAWDAVFLLRHGGLLSKLGAYEQAEVAVLEAAKTWKSLCNDHPDEHIAWEAVPLTYHALSQIQHRMGQHQNARRSQIEAEIGQLLLDAQPR